jgi:hypothetical protein
MTKNLKNTILKLQAAIQKNFDVLGYDPKESVEDKAESTINTLNNCYSYTNKITEIDDIYGIGLTEKEIAEHHKLYHDESYEKYVKDTIKIFKNLNKGK